MNPDAEKEGAQLLDAIDRVHEEIERASEEDAPLEDIEGAKTLAAELIDRYDGLLMRLGPGEQVALRQQIGHVIEQVKGKLMQLKEAPE